MRCRGGRVARESKKKLRPPRPPLHHNVARRRACTVATGNRPIRFQGVPRRSNFVIGKQGRHKTRQGVSLEAKRNATRIKYYLRKNRRSRIGPSKHGTTQACLPCESEIMKLRSAKAKLLLVLLCGGLLSGATLPASAQAPASPPGVVTAEKPRAKNQFPYGLLGLLGLLGLGGLMGRKEKSKGRSSQERPPAPPGSYVSDLTKDPRTRSE